jgi:penicillin-binding protein 1A
MPPRRRRPTIRKSRPPRRSGWLTALKQKIFSPGFFKALVLTAIWGSVLLVTLTAFFAYEIPDILRKADLKRHPAIIMEDREGHVFARYGDLHGDTVTVSTLPRYLVHAFLAIEDRRFYEHGGVDVWGIMRASIRNMIAGHVVQGGSTITQQLAKNLFLGNKRTLRRKVQELLLSLWLENKLSKDEILSAYLNRIYLGSGTYGVDAASRLYFNKTAREVNLHEATVLASLPKAPSLYSPLNNPKASEARARVVLQAMIDAKFISQKAKDTFVSNSPLPRQRDGNSNERYFADWVMEQLGGLIDEQDEDVIIRTTLDTGMQNAAEKQIALALRANSQSKQVSQAALVTINRAGAVRALVGGSDYGNSSFNRASQAKRQPGSAFKPFVFLTALNRGISADTPLLDGPLKIGSWQPQNFDKDYRGSVSMKDALAYSLNTATIRLAQMAGINSVRQTAVRMGISPPLENNLSLALGTSEVSLVDITSAYAAIANHGRVVIPYGIEEIRTKSGAVLFKRPAPEMPQVVDSDAADGVSEMMRAAVNYGTARRAALDMRVAGKTGTTQDYRDAWFIGFTDKLTTGVWMGNDDNTPMLKVTGGSLPAQLWHDYMLTASGKAGNEPDSAESAAYSHEQSNGITHLIEDLFGGKSITIENTYPTGKR